MNGLLASPLRNLLGGLIYMAVVMVMGTIAYEAAGWRLGDAVYMVILTVYTVGYTEVRPIDTPLLRGITIALIVLGCTGMIFLTGAIVQLITASQFQQILGLRRMQSQIDQLSGHVIVCGYGRIGQTLAQQLHAGQARFVVIDRNEETVATAREHGFIAMHGNAEEEPVLQAAGIDRARCLATVLPDDAANVFITLSARSLNRTLTIISRGELPSTESKLLQAGADRVVMPTHIGAERVAELILYPEAARFLHDTARKEEFARDLRLLGLDIEVVTVDTGSACVGRTVGAIEQEAAGAFLVLGLNRRDGPNVVRPDSGTMIEAGDGVVIVGRPGRARVMATIFERSFSRLARG
ncbi:MAG: NAD-binding protein [Proteobacteria bacterium]|nr:NAD-binding protein [Pseudomonadota bacterium]